jgi:polyhydroxyalkanoate synthesis regulator phasin
MSKISKLVKKGEITEEELDDFVKVLVKFNKLKILKNPKKFYKRINKFIKKTVNS